MWYDFLKTHPLQFYRQYIIGEYIVDFYCPKAMLVIELDGSQHYDVEAQKYDVKRTKYLSNLGITVLRFTNLEVNKDFRGVCEMIERYAKVVKGN